MLFFTFERNQKISSTMKTISLAILTLAAIASGCKSKGTNADKGETLKINFESKSGSKATGTAEFVQKGNEVIFTAKLSGLEPGVHAIHIHEKADCSASDASSAGGHWNPTFKKHGKWGDSNHHKGDIGNFTADVDGNGTVVMTTEEWCVGCGDKTKDVLGKGLIVHQKADDYVTQPTGDAGGRVACTAIIK